MTKRFCTKWNEPVEIREVSGSLTCITHGHEIVCTEAKCKYSVTAVLKTALFGSDTWFPDYTVELGELSSNEIARSRGSSKICDVCAKSVYRDKAFLLHTDTILSSDEFVDFVINGWVKKGMLPFSVISNGITKEMRAKARLDIRMQGGSTPWVVCESCLPMFSLTEQDKTEAQKRALQFWKGEKVEGVKVVIGVADSDQTPSIKETSKKWWKFWK